MGHDSLGKYLLAPPFALLNSEEWKRHFPIQLTVLLFAISFCFHSRPLIHCLCDTHFQLNFLVFWLMYALVNSSLWDTLGAYIVYDNNTSARRRPLKVRIEQCSLARKWANTVLWASEKDSFRLTGPFHDISCHSPPYYYLYCSEWELFCYSWIYWASTGQDHEISSILWVL